MARLRLFGSVEVSNRTVEKIKSSLVNRVSYTYSVVVRINKAVSLCQTNILIIKC
ncbi:hypothetical protein HanPI659440_Chr02g0047941 [Helianthus annuus]|nr:hypothetical protein HanPI659440_Chr02g0047941 [Helianthus annuus]